jgi:hypothetical protein
MRHLYFVLFSLACSCCVAATHDHPQSDGGECAGTREECVRDGGFGDRDAAPVDARDVDAAAPVRPDAGDLPLCSVACPGASGSDDTLTAWWVDGSYWWSYCLPSYEKCIDPSQCGSNCPP